MQKTCTRCGEGYECFDEDLALYEKVSPVFGGKKYLIPVSELCPYCRFVEKGAFRNEHTYYRTKSSMSGKPLISVYEPNSLYKVFSYDEWWGDCWNALDYGRDFDFERGFFEQFAELFVDVPKMNLIQDGTSENCEYTNFGSENKNCYLTLGFRAEDICYSTDVFISKDCVDCFHIIASEKLYECVSSEQCFNSSYLNKCNQCTDSYFLENCISCKNCLGCKNLRHKQFCVFNKLYSEVDYFEILKKYQLDTNEGIEKFKKEYEKFKLTLPCLFATQRLSENSTGEFLDGAKNCHECFITLAGAENTRYGFAVGRKCKDMIDCSNCDGELNCYSDGMLNSQRVLFSHFIRNCSEVSYSMFCYNSQNLFGCTGLVRKQYCIFNKQYSKEEYEVLVPKIVEHMIKTGEWGKYFPLSMSAFGYNETFAYDMNPMLKEDALRLGYKWSDYQQDTEISGENCVVCEVTGRPFRLIKQELEFYKKQGIPLPNRHPDVRIEQRYRIRNPNKFWKRQCGKCGEEIVTTYDPKRPEVVYCEKCFLAEVY
ncbi:MAG: hypothetical protein WCX95_02060 [Candidatus Gracilibacteria bacterium]